MCKDNRWSGLSTIAFVVLVLSFTPTQAEMIASNGFARQGGDVIESAMPIAELPFTDSGTTIGYSDDYDATCPTDDIGPDVCYRYVPPHDMVVSIDLCGSNYDTKVYVLDENESLVVCNDDYYGFGDVCGTYVSRIEEAHLSADLIYYVIVDGASAEGLYELEIRELLPCEIEIPPDAVDEGEPPLQDGYTDQYNGGCASPQYGYPVQMLEGGSTGTLLLHGRSGWYDTSSRDRDWFVVESGADGVVRIELTPEHRTSLLVYRQWICEAYSSDFRERADRCETVDLTIVTEPGSTLWLTVIARQVTYPFDQVGHEYDYLLSLAGLQATVAVEPVTWSDVKAQFR